MFPRIHLATHGKFQAESPLDSGLMLARDGENDGLLRVGELYSMDLDAELVTLSACETGLGKVDNGDDVVGLTRGFLYAGARSIVASLWSVEDRATAELMKAFYEGLQGAGKRDALRQAQLKTRAAFPHPYFWAAFQLVGRPE
ncbi:MAG: CHAT domain-containing protein [Betaproteobacteria bacterium]|nr:CHAT domain-containing protein [Betaproteobacteria bacterium]